MVSVDTLPPAPPRPWRRADLHALSLHPLPGSIESTVEWLEDVQRAPRLRECEAEGMLTEALRHPRESTPVLGERYLATGQPWRARSGSPCFSILHRDWDPSPAGWAELVHEARIVELDLVRSAFLSSYANPVGIVEVTAVHGLEHIARRLAGEPESDPAGPLTYGLIEGAAVHRYCGSNGIMVLLQAGQEMDHWMAFEHVQGRPTRLIAQWEHIGGSRVGVLGARALTPDDIERLGIREAGGTSS